MVDAKRLRMLLEVARAGSFSAAAAALHYTPGAVWQQIQALEAEAGQPLVVRHRTGAELTAAGEAIVRAATPALEHLDEVEQQLIALRRRADGWLGAVATTDAASAVLAGALASLRREAPELGVELSEHTPPRCLRAVASGQADVAVVAARPGLLDCPPPLEVVCSEPEPQIAVFPPGHPVGAIPEPDLAKIEAVAPLLAGDERPDGPGVRCRSGSAIVLLAMVQRGLGVAVLPGLAVTVLPTGVDWVPLTEPPRRRVVVVAGTATRGQAAVQALLEELRRDIDAHVARWRERAALAGAATATA
jgi:molybdate transport repressor ModE-like protein